MKTCPNCKNSVDDLSTQCNYCGANLSSGYNDNQQVDQYNNQYNTQEAILNKMALTSLIVGIVSLIFICCCNYIGIVGGALAIVFGIMAKKQIEGSNGMQKGEGMALAGIIVGSIGLLGSIASLIYGITHRKETEEMLNKFLNSMKKK